MKNKPLSPLRWVRKWNYAGRSILACAVLFVGPAVLARAQEIFPESLSKIVLVDVEGKAIKCRNCHELCRVDAKRKEKAIRPALRAHLFWLGVLVGVGLSAFAVTILKLAQILGGWRASRREPAVLSAPAARSRYTALLPVGAHSLHFSHVSA